MAKKRAVEENQEYAGIPESPALRRVELEPAANPLAELHVGGTRLGDLPLEVQGRILYQQTDEGIAEANQGKVESAARVTRDTFSKAMDKRAAQVKELDMDVSDAENPMKELADKHIAPGMRGRFLSPRVCDRRGMRGWQPVLDEHGNQVKVRESFLAQMPEDKAIERNKRVREHGNRLLGQVRDQYLAEGGKSAVSD